MNAEEIDLSVALLRHRLPRRALADVAHMYRLDPWTLAAAGIEEQNIRKHLEDHQMNLKAVIRGAVMKVLLTMDEAQKADFLPRMDDYFQGRSNPLFALVSAFLRIEGISLSKNQV